MIHFNDNTISFGDRKTLCGLTHKFVFKESLDEIYMKLMSPVDCNMCRGVLIKTGKIILSRFELINNGL